MALILNGKPVTSIPDGDRVQDEIVFEPGMPNTRGQLEPWAGVGLHWTGGERGWEGVTQTLLRARLSVQFIVETDGPIVQTADLTTRCAHIGGPGNGRFIGVEIVCRGYATQEDLAAARAADPTLRERDELDWQTPRDTYRDAIGGRAVHMAGFTVEQLRSAIWLCETLAGVVGFPRQVPARRVDCATWLAESHPVPNPEAFLVEHDGATWVPSFDRDPRKGPDGLAATWRGAIGHLHVHPQRHDPGTQVLYALWAEGWNPAGRPLYGAVPIGGPL